MKKFLSTDAKDTQEIGYKLGTQIRSGMSIALSGDLGAGKTTFVQGFAKGLGVPEGYYVTSPTFTILNTYPGTRFNLCHLDLYRLSDADELEYIGFEDLIDDKNVIVVEWPDLLNDISHIFDLEINFEFDAQYNRTISIHASGQAATNLLSSLIL